MNIVDYELNEYQKKAIMDKSKYTIVNAQVGSGKTTVLIEKIFYLYKHLNVKFKDMVVLTFTNKAANEIKERMKKVDPKIIEEDMTFFGTFHSVALKLLRDVLPIGELGYRKDFTVMDQDEVLELANDLIIDNKLDIKYKNNLNKRLEKFKMGELFHSSMKTKDDIETLVELINKEKIKLNKMDFDDLLDNAIRLLKTCKYNSKYIIVDEFQDCNNSQMDFIKGLKDDNTNIFVVGDPNQLIYSWRGSKLNLFQEFKKEFNATELSLPINYRSSTTVLDLAKHFISNSSELEGARDTGNKIIVKNHYNPFNEAQYLCDKIVELKNKGIDYKDIAILYRLQKQSKVLEDTLTKFNLPYEVSIKKTLKDIPVLQWFIKLLKASINPEDKSTLFAVLTNEKYGERMSKAKVRRYFKDESKYSIESVNAINNFKDYCKEAKCEKIGEQLYKYFDLDKYIMPTSSSYESDKLYIHGLLSSIEEYIKYNNLSIYEGLIQFLNSSALYGLNIIKEDRHLHDDAVNLMTLHACKGLEFKYVFIIGVNYGAIPIIKTSSEEKEEEKRLFFVGITRAKDNLELSFYTNPEDYRVLGEPSHFINIIPESLIDMKEMRNQKVDFRDIARQVKANIEQNKSNNEVVEEEKPEERIVEHDKYGRGTVISEDNDFITVDFEKYKTKTFCKMFESLRFL